MAKKDIEISIAGDEDKKKWDQFIDSSPAGSIFHKTLWLKAAAEETKTDLIRIIGFLGQNIFFVLPLFLKKTMGLKFAFSPPPKCLIPDMGLVLAGDRLKQDSFEKKYFSAVDAIERFIESKLKVDFIRIVNPVKLNDLRPFKWHNYGISPNYTYFINLKKGEKALYESVKGQVRTDIKRAKKYAELEIISVDREGYFELIQLVRDRYAEQQLTLPVSDTYLGTIYDEFSMQNHLEVKVIRSENSILTGLILLKYKDKIQHWIGGIVPKEKYIGVNELLHWSVITQSLKGDIHYYDLVGANTRHLCRSKSKFNPSLEVYFQIEKGNLRGNSLRFLYDKYVKRSSL